jgi:Caspase domain
MTVWWPFNRTRTPAATVLQLQVLAPLLQIAECSEHNEPMKRQTPIARLQLATRLCCVAISALLLMPRLGAAELTDADLKRMRSEKRVALVIGNGDYRNFQRLDNPVNDARGVAEALTAAGFAVTLQLDATREQMIQALSGFDQSLRAADVGLFYFAGHAAQVDWRNFMVPVAAQLDASGKPAELVGRVQEQAVDLADVLKLMGDAGKRLNIVVLDACRDNPFTNKAIEVSRP